MHVLYVINRWLTDHQVESRGISSLIATARIPKRIVNSFAWLFCSRLRGDTTIVTFFLAGSSSRVQRVIGKVLPLPVPADIKLSRPRWSARIERSCISRGTILPWVTAQQTRELRRHIVRSSTPSSRRYSCGKQFHRSEIDSTRAKITSSEAF